MTMTELWSSFSKWFGEKANSPLYWTYFGFFIAWNWEFFQVIFLESNDLFERPRIEYLKYLEYHFTRITPLDWLINTLWHIGPPILFTFAAIVWLPRVHKWAFNIHLIHLFERKIMFQEQKAEYEKRIAKLTKQEAVAKKEQAEQKQIIEKAKTQEEKWKEDFEQIKRQDLLQTFQRLVGVLYKQGGILYGTQVEDYLPNASSIMAFAGTHDLINTEKRENGSPLVQLTDKGKYFSRLLADRGIMAQ